MYSLRQMNIDDKVCKHVDLRLVEHIYPKEVIKRCVEQSDSWSQKKRRVRKSTAYTLVWFIIFMGLWSYLNQCQVWEKLIGKLSDLHPDEEEGEMSDSALSSRRKVVGSQGLRMLMHERCHVLADPIRMPMAFFGRYRIMAIDGTLFATADTLANDAAFGRSKNQYGRGAYPHARCVLLSECGSHAVVGLDICGYNVSERHGAYRLLDQVVANNLVTIDAGINSAGFLERVRERGAHALGPVEKLWKYPLQQRILSDGSRLVQLAPSRHKNVLYPLKKPLWVRIISYRLKDERLGEKDKVYHLVTTLLNPVTAPAMSLIELYHERWEIELVLDEIKTHERAQHKVLRSKTPEGVLQELYGIFLGHYFVRALMVESAVQAGLDPDRLSFTEGLVHVCNMMEGSLLYTPEAAVLLLTRLYKKLRRKLLPKRHLRVNRREVKQVYNKYKPKKRNLPPPAPFEPHKRFLDFVDLLSPDLPCDCIAKGA